MKPTERFSSRVENYVKYRPRYPNAVLEILRETGVLSAQSVIADLGSGTGFLTELFLREGHRAYGIEPNREMRLAGEAFLAGYGESFISVDGTAENTTLPAASIDLVVAGQAFHWFEVESARQECRRILKPGGAVALVWNERRVEDDAFQAEYEGLLREFGTDYHQVTFQHRVDETQFSAFFADGGWSFRECPNEQIVDFQALSGRHLSASYVPEPGAPRFEEMMSALRRLFDARQVNGSVTLRYRTKVYWGGV